jgi:alpha-glucuronidase
VAQAEVMKETWRGLESFVDPRRHRDVSEFLAIQANEAKWWRDASLAYWMSLNGLALPQGAAAPEHSLEFYRSLTFPEAPGN